MNILLLSPPVFDFYFTPARREPLGLMYLKEYLSQMEGIKLDLYDSTLSRKTKKKAFPEHFKYLEDYYKQDASYFSLFSTYKRFGDSFTKIIRYIHEQKIDLVVISALFSGYFNGIEALIREIKKQTKAFIIVGGWAVEAEREHLFKDSLADFFVYGESEENLFAFIQHLKDGLLLKKDGVLFKEEMKASYPLIEIPQYETPTFDFNQFPKREASYFFKGKRIAKVTLSRGCKFSCDFCAIHRYHAFQVRHFDSIIKELEYLVSLGVEIVDFEDDNLFFQSKWNQEFLAILRHFHKQGLSYTAMNGITAVNLAPMTEEAIEAGFIEFNLSLVTSHKKTASSIQRPVFARHIESIANVNQQRIEMVVFLIAGLKENSVESLLNDILYLASLPVKIGFSPLYLLPGIAMFEALGLPKNRDFYRGSALYRFFDGFDREVIVSLWKLVRMINAIKEMDDSLELEENIENFKRSIREKCWYYKKRDGKWEPYLKFSSKYPLNLPKTLLIKRKNHVDYRLELDV